MSQFNKNFNYVKWGFILASVGTIATVLTVPEFRCGIGLLSDTCSILQKEVELITQTETGEALAGVKLQVISKGAPENQYTDSNGYVKVSIASRGDVRVNLSKSGYPTQDFFVNLANDQNTVRLIRFSQSGQPEVISAPTIPSTPPTSPSPSQAEEITWNETASRLTGKVDQDFAYTCPPNGTVNNVWGTDFYTIGSSICSAAVHAGIINAKDGGNVKIRIRPGEEFYNSTTRNGVTSNRYGSYKGSFTFLDLTGTPISKEQVQLLEWNETASALQGKLDQDFTYACNKNGTVRNVWGTDIYTIGSSICSAAVHAGIINAKDGGNVQIRIRPGEKFYNGTTRNGVTSNRYNSYDWSFKFIR
ncbi:LCCL domain-containing protein [Altericista sp. CCNU0014]|uniref:LCCL domain-containing protein n=1 Tax=Altericista sp. CCNU0014 TaxID=3082949 RepID=UPI00384C2AAF